MMMMMMIKNFQFGKISARAEPDRFRFVGIQLQTTGCVPDCHVRYTTRQTHPYDIDVIRTAAGIKLSVVSVEVRTCLVSGQHVGDVFSVGDTFMWL